MKDQHCLCFDDNIWDKGNKEVKVHNLTLKVGKIGFTLSSTTSKLNVQSADHWNLNCQDTSSMKFRQFRLKTSST